MTPLGNKVIVKPIVKEEKKTAAGLILVEEKQPLSKSTVIHPPIHMGEPPFKAGDVIVHPAGAGSKVPIDGDEYLILSYDECWAVL